jgi:DNA repair protein RecN (Recombination protein N)
MKAIAMDIDGVGSMVFDDIDTGVSGRMAQVVGEKMCRIACNRQVLCVTHLPQIAALGNAHYLVEKHSVNERTETVVNRLDNDGRVRELSRLVGGAEDSESSLSHASHMLMEAIAVRNRIQLL